MTKGKGNLLHILYIKKNIPYRTTMRITSLKLLVAVASVLQIGSSCEGSSQHQKSTFRPQPHAVTTTRIEKYRYGPQQTNGAQQEPNDGRRQDLHNNDNNNNSSNEYSSSSENNQNPSVQKLPTSHNIVQQQQQQQQQQQRRIIETIQNRLWNGLDDIDKQIIGTTLPLSALFAIMPISMALNLFWVNRLGDALAVAGQAAANQVYNSAFWLFSFLPSVTATLVSKSHSEGDISKTQDSVCQALIVALMISLVGTSFMFFRPLNALSSILKEGSSATDTALPYLRIRAFSFMPMLVSFVGFATFRGIMDVKSTVAIAVIANAVTAILDPIFIHVLDVGVRGAAMATLSGDIFSAVAYLKLMKEKNLIPMDKLMKIPSWKSIAPLVKGGLALQIRSFAMNLTGILVARRVQSIDGKGIAPAAHALCFQTFQLGGIFLFALGMGAQTLVPNSISKDLEEERHVEEEEEEVMMMTETTNNSKNGFVSRRTEVLVRRLFSWGLKLGLGIGILQLLFLPNILSSTPLQEVRDAARNPALISIAFQGINGIVNVGEGILMGTGNFTSLSINIVLASLCYAGALQFMPKQFGLTGVWMSLAIFNLARLVGVVSSPVIQRQTRLFGINDKP